MLLIYFNYLQILFKLRVTFHDNFVLFTRGRFHEWQVSKAIENARR